MSIKSQLDLLVGCCELVKDIFALANMVAANRRAGKKSPIEVK